MKSLCCVACGYSATCTWLSNVSLEPLRAFVLPNGDRRLQRWQVAAEEAIASASFGGTKWEVDHIQAFEKKYLGCPPCYSSHFAQKTKHVGKRGSQII